jgi:hypothetical protein
MNAEQLMNVLVSGLTKGTITANTTIYLAGPIDHGVLEIQTVKIVPIGNGTKVVIS